MRPVAIAVAVSLLAACAAGGPVPAGGVAALRDERLEVDGASFALRYAPEDAAEARRIRALLPSAVARARRFGRLVAPVTITLHPSHAALEAAVGREGFDWLHAWARYATVDLQSPRTWDRGFLGLFGPGDRELGELLAHELSHCAMYQRAGDAWSWPYKRIPLWFREGLATVAAGTAPDARELAAVAAFYREARASGSPDDPVAAPEALYRTRDDVVYGAAHHAFEFLLARHGEGSVLRLLDLMGERGRTFPEAFAEVTGTTPGAFAAEFRGYVEAGARR